MLGFTAEEWQRDPEAWSRQVHPDDRDAVIAAWADAVDHGRSFRAEYRIFTRDGRERWFLDEAAVVSERPDGRPGLYQGVMLDITQRKEAEARLSEAEQRYRGLVEQLPVVVYIDAADDVSTATYVSPQYERLLGYTAEERLARPELWVQILHPDDRERVMAESHRTNRTGEPFRMEYRLIHKDGHVVWVRDEAEMLRDAAGQPIAWQGVLLDVTEQKVAEEGLRRRDDILRAVGFAAEAFLGTGSWEDRIDDVLSTLGRAAGVSRIYVFRAELLDEGRVTRQLHEWTEPGIDPQIDNPAMLEFRADELGFGGWLDTLATGGTVQAKVAELPEPQRGILAEQGIRAIAQVPVFAGDQWWGLLGFDDCRREREWSLAEIDVLRTAAGVLGGAIARQESDRTARAAEERYRALVEHIPAVLYIDRADESMTGVYVSPQVERLLGVEADAYLHDDDVWDRRVHPEDHDRVVRANLDGMKTDRPWSIEYRWIRPDDRIVWIRDEAVVLHDERGRPAFVQGVMFDITERKLAEVALAESERREREAAERLRTLDEMKNTFLAAVSHELRSPLTSILGLALTLERTDLPDEDRRDLVGRLASNAEKLDRLLSDLLDIDRLNRGIVSPQYRMTPVDALVHRTVESMEQARDRAIRVAAEPIQVEVDPAKVERIVENLVANAVRHTTADATIWVRVEPLDGGVMIAVEDDGPGVPDELRDAIFEPFRQGPSTTPHAPGTGIGLSLVARFAELHGGRAWVEDRPGGGASFRVFLPGVPVAQDDGSDEERPPPGAARAVPWLAAADLPEGVVRDPSPSGPAGNGNGVASAPVDPAGTG
jgi:PAS domain S-box-containing protein